VADDPRGDPSPSAPAADAPSSRVDAGPGASSSGDAAAGTAAAGGGHFGGAAGFGARPAVVVVDLNLGFTDPASPLACDLDDVVIRTRALLDVARRIHVPVCFTSVVYDELGEAAAAVFLRKVPALKLCRPGTRWVEIDPRLGRLCSEPLIAKAHASAFFGVPFATLLAGRDTLIVCGASTSGCVRATVVDAMQHGFAPIVPRECVGDRSSRAHEQALADIEGRYGDVRSAEEVISALEAVA
jgi:nicotinamidase-related amidase